MDDMLVTIVDDGNYIVLFNGFIFQNENNGGMSLEVDAAVNGTMVPNSSRTATAVRISNNSALVTAVINMRMENLVGGDEITIRWAKIGGISGPIKATNRELLVRRAS